MPHGRLIHVGSVSIASCAVDCGTSQASKDGMAFRLLGKFDRIRTTYPMSYPQTKMSFGYNHGFTALFDFVTPGEEAVIRCWDRARSFLCPLPCRVLLQFDRQCLKSRLIQNCAGYDSEKRLHRDVSGNPLGFIPHIEVWYPEPILTNAICEAYFISNECDWDKVMPSPLHVGHD